MSGKAVAKRGEEIVWRGDCLSIFSLHPSNDGMVARARLGYSIPSGFFASVDCDQEIPGYSFFSFRRLLPAGEFHLRISINFSYENGLYINICYF